jgi:hypothetical protein
MSLDEPKVLHWSPLKCKNTPDGVDLYYDFSNSATGMLVAVTDLCSVWDLSFDREAVLEIAREQNSSIDPAESATQLRTLLKKLKHSLGEGNNVIGHSEHYNEEGISQYLSVRTILKLPAPLKLLRWTFDLPQRDKNALAESITFPVVHEAIKLKQQMETLYQIIKDKDHVLSKLLDKVDNSAIDLSLMFPGISGLKSRKQRMNVAEASKYVPGMANFDRNSWEAGIARSYSGISNKSIDLSNILDCSKINTTTAIPSADWFRTLPTLDEDASSLDRSGSETDDDSRETASRPKQSAEAKLNNSDASTDSQFEDLADTPRRRKEKTIPAHHPASSPSSCGALTKQHASSSLILASRSRPVSNKRRASDSSSDSDSEKSIKRGAKTSHKTTSKIGMLGGKRKASPTPQSSPPFPISNVSTPSRKLEVLGGRPATESPSKSPVPFRTASETLDARDKAVGSDTASSTSSTPASLKRRTKSSAKVATPPPIKEEPPEVEESVEEKAKRKREELKRMQAQANAGLPKKKVRRF